MSRPTIQLAVMRQCTPATSWRTGTRANRSAPEIAARPETADPRGHVRATSCNPIGRPVCGEPAGKRDRRMTGCAERQIEAPVAGRTEALRRRSRGGRRDERSRLASSSARTARPFPCAGSAAHAGNRRRGSPGRPRPAREQAWRKVAPSCRRNAHDGTPPSRRTSPRCQHRRRVSKPAGTGGHHAGTRRRRGSLRAPLSNAARHRESSPSPK